MNTGMEEERLEKVDWITQEKLAELAGFTGKAMDRKRQRGLFPEGRVWIKFDGRVMYSIKGYNEWLSKLGSCLQESSQGEILSGSGSTGTKSATTSQSRGKPRRQQSSVQPVYAVK